MRNKHLVKICTVAAVIAFAAAGCASKGETKPADTAMAATEASQEVTEQAQAEQDTSAVKNENSTTDETEPEDTSKGIFEEFKAQDLDGKEVTQAVFANHDLTLVNVWATFCGPCLSEMPELGELNTEYSKQGFQVVGVVADVLDGSNQVSSSQLTEAKSIVNKTKASYLHIVPTGDLSSTLLPQVAAVPTSVFVDKNGKQVGMAVVGAKSKSSWEKLINENLKAVEAK